MTNIVIANAGYADHMTSEGFQLQESLRHAGWLLVGYGYGDNCVDVRVLLERHNPDIVLVQAGEDLRADSAGCFDKRCSFTNIDALANHRCWKIHVVKDSARGRDRREAWCEEVKADALLLYYHEKSMTDMQPWIGKYPFIRHRHTIDRDVVKSLAFARNRSRAIVSGAINKTIYPVRTAIYENAKHCGVEVLKHPSYAPNGNRSNDYLQILSDYKVSVACSSVYGFALRKQLEAVAAGCMVVTDLPDYDGWPHLDDAMVRVKDRNDIKEIKAAIDKAEATWTPERAESFRERACVYYDYKVSGASLSDAIIKAAGVPA